MALLLGNATAELLRKKLRERLARPQRDSRSPAVGRYPLLVRCTSTTPAGTGIGAECYPAVVLDPMSDELIADQPELGAVWLTVISGGVSIVPTVDEWYEGLLSGMYDPGGDERPRVFATHGTSSISYDASGPSGDISIYDITADDTWEATGIKANAPSSGAHLLLATIAGGSKVSAFTTQPGAILARLYNNTAAAVVETNGIISVVSASVVNVSFTQTAHAAMIETLTAGDEIEVQAFRNSGPTWTTSQIRGTNGGVLSRLNLLAL